MQHVFEMLRSGRHQLQTCHMQKEKVIRHGKLCFPKDKNASTASAKELSNLKGFDVWT